jgi:hypothetical protein
MEACYGGTDVMERSCAVARGIDINKNFLEVPTDFLNHFWIQVTVSLLKPPNGQKFNGYVFNGHSPTDEIARSGVTVM